MRVDRRLSLVVLLVPLAAVVIHCDNGAVGVEACRTLESKRCELVRGCAELGIETDSDVKTCQLFYRDQCIFGVADDAASPDDATVALCSAALETVAACKGVASLSECPVLPAISPEVDLATATACETLRFPERLDACAFLRPAPVPAGGTGGEAGAAGAAGMGGSAGAGGG